MQLNQPIPPTPAGGESPYDFILSGNHKPSKKLLSNRGNSKRQRLLIAVLGGLGLLFVIAVIVALLVSGNDSTKKNFTGLVQTQTEIIRITTLGNQKATSSSAQHFSEMVGLVMTSSEQQTNSYLSKHGTKLKSKELALGKNAGTDKALAAAAAAGTYDNELITILERSLANYQANVSDLYKTTSSATQKKLLQNLYDQATTLIKNQPATSS
jgi:hypothetical protein